MSKTRTIHINVTHSLFFPKETDMEIINNYKDCLTCDYMVDYRDLKSIKKPGINRKMNKFSTHSMSSRSINNYTIMDNIFFGEDEWSDYADSWDD